MSDEKNKKGMDMNMGPGLSVGGDMGMNMGMPDMYSGMGNAGSMPGMQGMMPGMQGMMPGMQGMMPGMQGMMPGMQGMMPGMPGMNAPMANAGMNFMPNPMMNPTQPMCCPFLMNMQCPMLYGQFGQGMPGMGGSFYPTPYTTSPFMNNMYSPMMGMQY
ncbi:MAG: hypothetical protein Q8920_10485 [Bacillota bacterium]|nr:hypothetical protein [Bacillota bacterium]